MFTNKLKSLVLFTVFIDIIGLGIVIPVLPFYVGRFSTSPIHITALFAVYALCSFISAPFIGALSDRYGRRPALIGSIASTALGWFVFASAPSLLFLYVGRIIDGLAAGNLPVAQSALIDLAKDSKERTANLGLIGGIFGIGFILGPFIGGALAKISHSFPFWFVAVLATINVILAYFFLPETRQKKVLVAGEPVEVHSNNPFVPIIRAVKDINLRPNYIALFLFGLAISGSQAVFSLYFNKVFGFNEFMIGLIFSGMGVVIAINQVFLMRKFWLKRFKEPRLELIMMVMFSLGYLVLAIPILAVAFIGLLATTFGQSVLRVVMNGQIVSKSGTEKSGEVLGVSASIVSLSAGIAPLVAGFLFAFKVYIPFVFTAFLLLLAFIVLYRERKRLDMDLSPDTPVISEV